MNERQCRETLRDRSGGACERCGRNWPPSTLHHRLKRGHLPKAKKWLTENCVMLCGHGTTAGGCHSWVEHNPTEAEAEGYHLRPWVKDPAEIPVLYRGRWAYLREDGSVEYTD